ncbi:MAG: hypothetical protein GZ086_14280, partial [Gelidibacter sp.]|nr:hypothetical protein [Gelidibacter sp.]
MESKITYLKDLSSNFIGKFSTKRNTTFFKVLLTLCLTFVFSVSVWGQTQTFTNPANNGTTSNKFTVPAGVITITIKAWAGGGGGGYDKGSGGGGGGYHGGTLTVSPGQVLDVYVGAGGSGGISGSVLGKIGGNSYVSSVTANGGNGGANAQGSGGAGGTGAFNGGLGGVSASGGGGGGGAGDLNNGTNASGGSGGAGVANFGGAGGTSSAGSNNGGGGAGGSNNAAGYNGANGQVIISWTVTCTAPTTSNPSNETITYGGNASFTVSASGSATLTYQWQEKVGAGSFVNITNGVVYSGATTATLTLTKPTVAMSTNQYQCIVTGACSPTATSNAASLTVNKATPVITWENPIGITYGTALSVTQLNATTTVAGSFVYSPVLSTVLNAGNARTLSVTFTPSDGANYNGATKDVVINVLKKTITVTADAGQTKVYGAADPAVYTYGFTPA